MSIAIGDFVEVPIKNNNIKGIVRAIVENRVSIEYSFGICTKCSIEVDIKELGVLSES